jgi:DNA-binding response OmpR family regulator
MGRAQVSIVDDDMDLAESIADYVEMHGHAVAIASNGKEAVDHFDDRL